MRTFLSKFAVFALFLTSVTAFASDELSPPEVDPYQAVEHIQLENGLQIFLAPSNEATTTAIRLEVGVGWEAETKQIWGISHLLEHVLFRDKQLKDEMSYLQLIREAGGEANGSTEARRTSYFGSIPAKKDVWLLEKFSKMILEPNITEDYVAKEKGTVELEIGRPSPITLALGFNPMDLAKPRYLEKPGFWEAEFGVNFDSPFTLTQEQLSNRKLKADQVKEHYENYYYPSNMKLFIVGKYNREQILKLIKEKWAVLPARTGKTLAAQPVPKPRKKPYQRFTVSENTPSVSIGTKVWDASVRDEEVLRSYAEYLSHRLMKEVRNLKGQTYTASANTEIYRGYGYSLISFQTQDENLDENLGLVKKLLETEAEKGQLTDAQVKEAVDLFLSDYQLRGREANSMMNLAVRFADVLELHGQWTSPFAALQSISPEEYNETLKRFYQPHQRYEMITSAPLLFPYDYMVMTFLTALVLFQVLRKFLTKPFANDQVRWIRKVKYPPMKMLEAFVLVIGWYAFAHVQHLIDLIYTQFNFLQSHVFFSQYVATLLVTFSMLIIAQGLFSLVPRKLMVVGEDLLVKSVTYYSRKIALSEIESVETVGTLSWPFPLKLWSSKVGFRYFYFNPKFWQKGLLIHLKGGRAYYFSVTAPEKACQELDGFVKNQNLFPKTRFEQASLRSG